MPKLYFTFRAKLGLASTAYINDFFTSFPKRVFTTTLKPREDCAVISLACQSKPFEVYATSLFPSVRQSGLPTPDNHDIHVVITLKEAYTMR